MSAIDLFFWALAAIWFSYTAVMLFCLSVVKMLPGLPADLPVPRVAVVVPARDEAERVETTIRRLLEQRGIDLEIVAIDDRSTDGTGEILDRLAAESPRVRVVHVKELPEGWLGKTHACHVGARETTAEWILFTDADVWMKEDVIARAVAAGVAAEADHVTLMPGESKTTLPAKAALLAFFNGMAFFAARANLDQRGSFIGVGAFNLVRARAYRAVGGHEALRFAVVDDMELGRRLRVGGFRSRAWIAGEDVEVSWSPTARGMIRALEKNLFAFFGFRFWLAGLAVLTGTVVTLGPWMGLLSGRLSGWIAWVGLASSALPPALASRRANWGVLPALLSPLMSVAVLAALAQSVFATVRSGGIRWRETAYSLDQLRKR